MSFVSDLSTTPQTPVRITSDKEVSAVLQRMRIAALNEIDSPEVQTKKGGEDENKVENKKVPGSNRNLSSTVKKKIVLSPNKKIEPVSKRINNLATERDENESDSEEIVPLRDILSGNKGSATPSKSCPFTFKLKRDAISSKSFTKTATSTVIQSMVAHNTSSKKPTTSTYSINELSSNNKGEVLSSNKNVTGGIENLNLVAKVPSASATKALKMTDLSEKENKPVPVINCVLAKIPGETAASDENRCSPLAVNGCGEFGVVSQKVFYVNNRCYHALNILGQGGSGKVYQVIESESSKILALKEVYLDKVDKTSYMNEINLLNKLKKSDRVITLYDHQVKSKTILLVLEKGDSDLAIILKQAKSGSPLSLIQIKYYWSELLLALKDVHKAGIIHLDLKPANFVQVQGKLKIIDFGIAGAIPEDKTCLVKENIIGTLNYMSPEQITGAQNNNTQFQLRTKSDVWSLGIILYHLLYGVTPFHHIANIACKLQAISNPNYQIMFSEIEDLHLLNVLKSCLQHDPKKRPTIEELLAHPFLTGH